MANPTEIAAILGMLSASYPRFKLEKDTVKVYTRLLQDIPTAELEAAAITCAASLDFFPSVHEIRRMVIENRIAAQGIPSQYQAWEAVNRAWIGWQGRMMENENGELVEYIGYFPWPHKLVEKVARSLGWPKDFPSENIPADRAHFFKAYEYEIQAFTQEQIRLPEVQLFIDRQRKLLGKGN